MPNLSLGDFHFRIADLSAAPVLTLGVETTVSITPGDRSQAYRVELGTAMDLVFGAIQDDAFCPWTLYDASGRLRESVWTYWDSGRIRLTSGVYFLIFNGWNSDLIAFDFSLHQASIRNEVIRLDTPVQDALEQSVQEIHYALEIADPTVLFFESLTNSSDLRWELSGPDGIVRYETGFDQNGTVIQLDSVGSYSLRVFSSSHSSAGFGFRLIDLDNLPPQNGSDPHTIALTPTAPIQVLAFDGQSCDYFSYQFDSFSASANVGMHLIDAKGDTLFSWDAGYDYSGLISKAGKYWLIFQGYDLSEPLELTCKAQMVSDREQVLALSEDRYGSIDASGQKESWSFGLERDRTLLLDGLAGNRVSWSLVDESGRRLFSANDLNGPNLLNLPAGSYHLVIQGNTGPGTVPGRYGFRLIDPAPSPVLTDGASEMRSLAASHAADLYRLTVPVGETWLLRAEAATGGGYLAIFDGYGAPVYAANFPLAATQVGTGDYWILVDSDLGRETGLDYSLTANRLQERVATASAGDTLSGTLAAAHEYHSYRLDLTTAKRLIIVDAGSDEAIRWRLTPAGMATAGWNSFPASNLESPLERLNAGEYSLTLATGNSGGGSYRIQLLDLDGAIPLGTGISGELAQGGDAQAYSFDIDAPRRLTLGIDTADPSLLGWALYDANGNPVVSYPSGESCDTDELRSGRYVLVLYGAAAPSETLAYAVSLTPIVPTPLGLGERLSGTFPSSGNQADFVFTLAARTTLVFDALQGAASTSFGIFDQTGTALWSGGFDQANANPWDRFITLNEGTFRLSLFGDGIPDYSFRLLSLSQVAGGSLGYGLGADGLLETGGEIAVHQFAAQAGDRFSVDLDNIVGGNVHWTLYDAVGSYITSDRVFSGGTGGASGLYVRGSGLFTLLIDGDLGNVGPVGYHLELRLDEHIDTRPEGEYLSLGFPTEALIVAETSQTYRFDLEKPSLIAISGSTAEYLSWRLQGQGVEEILDWADFYGGAGVTRVYDLPAGGYALTFDNESGIDIGVTFLVEDEAHAQVLSTNQNIETVGSRLFRLDLERDEPLYFRSAGSAEWVIFGPDRQPRLWIRGDSESFGEFKALESGEHFIAFSMDYSGQSTISATLELSQERDLISALALGDTQSGQVAGSRTNSYSFTLTEPRPLLLDLAQIAGAVDWQLTQDGQGVASGRWQDSASSTPEDNPLLNLGAGDYRLTLAFLAGTEVFNGEWWVEGPARYAFRLFDLPQLILDGLDGSITGTLVPGEARVLRFAATAGDSLIYQPLGTGSLEGSWRLFDGSGNPLDGMPITEAHAVYNLPSTGDYYLVWDSNGQEVAFAEDYAFTLSRVTPNTDLPLPPIGEAMTGTTGEDGTLRYRFHADGPAQYLIDILDDSGVYSWLLLNDQGQQVAGGDLWDSDLSGSLLSIESAGDYSLMLVGDAFTFDAVNFRLLDVAATARDNFLGEDMAGSIETGGALAYRLAAEVGQTLVYDPRDLGGMTGRWLILDATGRWVSSGEDFNRGGFVRAIPTGGIYFLLLDSAIDPSLASAAYAIRFAAVTPVAQTPSALALDTEVNAAFGEDGALRYQFQINRSSLLWLDFLNGQSGIWSLTDVLGNGLSNGSLDGAKGALLRLATPGSYVLSLLLSSPATEPLRFRLADLAAGATAIAAETRIDGTLDPGGSTRIYRFDALSGNTFKFISHGAPSADVRWTLYNQSGFRVAEGEAGVSSPGFSLNDSGSGRYYLVIDGASSNTETVSFGFTASLNRLAFNQVYSGVASYYGQNRYDIHLDQPTWLAFDAMRDSTIQSRDSYLMWRLTGTDGTVFDGQMYWYGYDRLQMLPAGDYALSLYSSSYRYSRPFQFRVLDVLSAAAVTSGEAVGGTLSPGNSMHLYRFDAVAGDIGYLRVLQSFSGYWHLFDPLGQEVLHRGGYSDSIDLGPLATGSYLLAIAGNNLTVEPQSYSFNLIRPNDKGPAAIGTAIAEILPAGSLDSYSLLIDQPTRLVFDSLVTGDGFTWRLIGPNGQVFSHDMIRGSGYDYYQDVAPLLAAGDYRLILENTSATASTYRFRLLGLESAQPLVPGTPMTLQITPANGAAVFRFDALASERYYFDNTDDGYRSGGDWRLYDPSGEEVFFSNGAYDYETPPFTRSGTYLLVLEGSNRAAGESLEFRFNVVPIPNNPPVVLDSLVVLPAPDLVLNQVSLTPAGGLTTGQTLNIQWTEENRGILATAGDWNDRIIVRNQDSGALVANITIPYEATAQGNGAMAPGEARTRNHLLRLPDGSLAAGRLSITVIIDADDVLKERYAGLPAEGNNALTVEVDVALAPYADLVVEDLLLTPAGDFQPGMPVRVTWNTANRGNKAVEQAWDERLEVFNLSSNERVAALSLRDDPNAGLLDVNGIRARVAEFTWPLGSSAAGRFAIRILTDSAAEIAEGNGTGTGESNNGAELIHHAGPDLQIRNLAVDATGIQAGGLLGIRWEDWNLGSSSTATGFEDRLVVRNLDSGLVLLDTSLVYDPLAIIGGQLNGLIQPGESRSRALSFRLPEGLKGTGRIGISVMADQNSAGLGVLFETNLDNDAEANNSADIQLISAARPYADLRVEGLEAPVTAVGGEAVTLSWMVSNQGETDAVGDWNDRILFSNDAIFGNGDDLVLGTLRHTGGLTAGGTYSQTATLHVPLRDTGRYYLGLQTDSGAELLEPDTRADNIGNAQGIDLAKAYADLNLLEVTAPTQALSGEEILVTWTVRNDGNATTDLALWNDRVVLSADTALSGDDIILSGSVTHAGRIAPGQGYTGRAILTLPRDLSGDYFVIVDTSANRSVGEDGHTANNGRATALALHIGLAPVADLRVSGLTGPASLRPGDTATLDYSLSNQGGAVAANAWRDRIYLDSGTELIEVASLFHPGGLEAGATEPRSLTFDLPTGVPDGEYHWVVRTDTDDSLYERDGEGNNQARSAATIQVARIDLAVGEVSGPGLVQSGDAVHLSWTVSNRGGVAPSGWVDRVYIGQGATLTPVAELIHNEPLGTGESYVASVDVSIPLDFAGEYQVVVVTDADAALAEGIRDNNRLSRRLDVALTPYADLAVSGVTALDRVIADPAPLEIGWSVTNQGTGAGLTQSWTDRVVLSLDDTYGNNDDRLIGEFLHEGGLAPGESYSRSERILLPPATTGRFKLFVVGDAQSQVFENHLEANNIGRAGHAVDVMPIPYADLQVASVTTEGTPASGRSLRVSWEVVNQGIGITDLGKWSDNLWLSTQADGSDMVASFGSSSHIGQLGVGDRYSRSLDVTLPEGIAGDYYLHVSTRGPFEFVHDDNNLGSSLAIPVSLSPSPDLRVETILLPPSAQEGALIDVTWTVVNQGEAKAEGVWIDSILLLPPDGGAAVTLGSFTYDRGLESGIRYSRTEQLRLPAKIEGLYRVKVVTNAQLGGNGSQVYEHGAARDNNGVISGDSIQVNLNDRPDLRVGDLIVPDHVTAGTGAGIRYSVVNQGPVATNGRWTDKVYLSLDGALSGDDRLVGQFDNGAALAPTESYANETAQIDIPIRFRGDAYLLVVADGNYNIDEYPNEANNIRAARFYVDPIPFADLVTGDVVAPDQAVHGASIEVGYRVSNRGSNPTRGEAAALDGWTDTIWLARDRLRPGAHKGDILLGSVAHSGHLAVGEDYRGSTQVRIPDDIYSGTYYVTVWSDAYDVILEDTLATYLNPDDPNEVDNNNYKARPIAILGITPPDLTVTEVIAPATADAGTDYSFSYTVQNRGDLFSGKWTDRVYISDDTDLDAATEAWCLGSYSQERSLANGESYSVSATVKLAPSVKGRYLVVKTDVERLDNWTAAKGNVLELNESNNALSSTSLVNGSPADLVVTAISTQQQNFSGEETILTWTVTNRGAAIWGGTRGWIDSVFLSSDPTFIPERATALGAVAHSNVSGLAAGGSYTTSAKVTLPPGTEGAYYIYVVTDSSHKPDVLADIPPNERDKTKVQSENLPVGWVDNNNHARDIYFVTSAYEGERNDNNIGRGALEITYWEPDLQVDAISLSDPNPASGQPLTVTWTVTNRGTRATRTNGWFDGLYLSRDASLDGSDHPLVNQGTEAECLLRVRQIYFKENGNPKYLQPGESYTASATFDLPESISGDFHLIVKADTDTYKDFAYQTSSSIRDGLDVVDGSGPGVVPEFTGEGNNVGSIALPISLATPPDLQVSQVTAPDAVLAGQAFTVSFTVVNAGGATPLNQSNWNDLVYLSKDRFLDTNQDRYVGYLSHGGGLDAGGSYSGILQVTAPLIWRGLITFLSSRIRCVPGGAVIPASYASSGVSTTISWRRPSPYCWKPRPPPILRSRTSSCRQTPLSATSCGSTIPLPTTP